MSDDPKRWLEETDDETERALLRAARGYQPPARVRRRTLVALGLGGLLSLSQLTAGIAATVAAKPWIAAGVVAVVVSGGVGVTVAVKHRAPRVAPPVVRPTAPERTLAPRPAVESPAAVEPPPAPQIAPPPKSKSVRVRAAAPAVEPALAPAPVEVAAPVEVTPPAREEVAPPASSIADEVTRLRRARTALGAGQLGAAAALLDAYKLQHPSGTMRLEADVLHIELLLARGDRAEGRRAAEAFLAAHPHSLLAPRVRAALGSTAPAPGGQR